jgi:hypothetical protein
MLPARTFTHHESTVSSLHRKRKQASPWRAFETRQSISRVLPPSHSGSKRRRGGPSKHVCYVCCNRHVLPPSLSGSKHHCGGPSKHGVAFPNCGPTPSLTVIASIANGEPQSPIVAPTPSLTAEANVASGEPIDLRAAESRWLMLVVVHTHLASDSASPVF